MQLEISEQIRWLKAYQDATTQGPDEEILERYSKEALNGADAAFGVLQDKEISSWSVVSRRRSMPQSCLGDSQCIEMEIDCDEEYESTSSNAKLASEPPF
jgi:hypothetical protein